MEDFTSFFTKIGYPYNWAQNLAGLQFLTQRMPGSSDNLERDGEEASTSQKSTLNPTTHTKQTVKLIRKRVRARISLTNQFLALGLYFIITNIWLTSPPPPPPHNA